MPAEIEDRWFVNGEPSELLAASDRAVLYGDGLFETMRIVDKRIPLLDWHLRRLENGVNRLGIALDIEALQRDLLDFPEQYAESAQSVLKLMISRGPGKRGYKPPAQAKPSVIMQLSNYRPPAEEQLRGGVILRFCQTQLGRNPALAGIKHLNRLEQVLARDEWDDDEVFEGLMADSENNLVEGTMSNVFFRIGSDLHTPLLDFCGVAGVARAVLMEEILPRQGVSVLEGRYSSADLLQAEEVFICNSLIGVLPVRQCSDRQWPVGALTLAAQQAWAALHSRENGKL